MKHRPTSHFWQYGIMNFTWLFLSDASLCQHTPYICTVICLTVQSVLLESCIDISLYQSLAEGFVCNAPLISDPSLLTGTSATFEQNFKAKNAVCLSFHVKHKHPWEKGQRSGRRVLFTILLSFFENNNIPAAGWICPHWYNVYYSLLLLEVYFFFHKIPLIPAHQPSCHHASIQKDLLTSFCTVFKTFFGFFYFLSFCHYGM